MDFARLNECINICAKCAIQKLDPLNTENTDPKANQQHESNDAALPSQSENNITSSDRKDCRNQHPKHTHSISLQTPLT